MEVNHHRNERFPDLYIMDKVWAAKKIWRERIKSVKLSPFQEAMLELGLREFHELQDQMLGCVDVPIGFTSVMAGECFEVICGPGTGWILVAVKVGFFWLWVLQVPEK